MGCKLIKRTQVNDNKKEVEVDENTFALCERLKELTEAILGLKAELSKHG